MALIEICFLIGESESRIAETGWGGRVALSNVGEQIENAFVLFLTSSLAEHVPEAECLVSCSGDDGFAVGTEGEVQDAVRVAGQLGDLS